MNLNSIKIREIKNFGMIAFIFFGLLSGLGFWLKKSFALYFFGALTWLAVGFILIPSRLRPVYGIWLIVAHLIGTMVNFFILTLVYYLALTPVAIIKRLISGHVIPLKPDKNTDSYWVIRTETAQPIERFTKRY